jgi:regulator of sigma E protease
MLLTNILALIVVLGILVFLHEGGHFLAARAAGARVSVFSFGFGKRLWGFERGGTDYRVSLIPLGGYVRIHGLGPDESDVVGGQATEEPLLPRLRRAGILLAGPGANAVSAVLFMTLTFMVGVQVPVWLDQPPTVAWIDPDSAALRAGIQEGDLVLSVDGRPMETWRDLEIATMSAPNRTLNVRILRNGKEQEVQLTPESVTRYELGDAGLAPAIPAEISGVLPMSPAETAGLRAGDRILAIDGKPVRHFYDFMRTVWASAGKELTISVERGGQTLEIKATPKDQGGQGRLGVPIPNPTVLKRYAMPAAFMEAGRETVRMTRETFAVLGRMFTGKASLKQMSGPIDIARFSGEAARGGLVAFIRFLGFISLQLAIFNLLPIPVLDGGHLAIIGIESVARRDFSIRTKERILNIGFWLIMALVVVVLFNDLAKTTLFDRFMPGN